MHKCAFCTDRCSGALTSQWHDLQGGGNYLSGHRDAAGSLRWAQPGKGTGRVAHFRADLAHATRVEQPRAHLHA